MIILLSPAKKQDFESRDYPTRCTQPQFKSETTTLITAARKLSKAKLKDLMSLSDKLTELNYQRYKDFDTKNYNKENAKPAVYALQGDAYQGLFVKDFNTIQLNLLQSQLVILSGLYGALRPMDLIQPYRLEMKIKLASGSCKDLYEFWRETLTKHLNQRIKKDNAPFILNLASNEYFKAINTKQLSAPIITAQFKQQRGDEYKMIGIYAKRARGLMTRYIAKNQASSIDDIKQFDTEGYQFNKTLSSDNTLVFTRSDD